MEDYKTMRDVLRGFLLRGSKTLFAGAIFASTLGILPIGFGSQPIPAQGPGGDSTFWGARATAAGMPSHDCGLRPAGDSLLTRDGTENMDLTCSGPDDQKCTR